MKKKSSLLLRSNEKTLCSENGVKRFRFLIVDRKIISSRTEVHVVGTNSFAYGNPFVIASFLHLFLLFPKNFFFAKLFREPFSLKARLAAPRIACKKRKRKTAFPFIVKLSLRELRSTTSFLQAVFLSFLCAGVAG